MPISMRQSGQAPCPECGQPVDLDVWLIVDLAERPDLAERIRAGTIHTIPCPHCGNAGGVDAPLLIHDAQRQRVIFVPPRGTSQEQDREIAGQLVGALVERLREDAGGGEVWTPPAYLGQVRAVPRELLPSVLDAEDSDTALQASAPRPRQALEGLRQEDPEAFREMEASPLLQTLQAFIAAETWPASRQVVEAHPELLEDEADSLLAQLVEAARARGDEGAVRMFEEHRALLRRCNEVGVGVAFGERMGSGGASSLGEIPPEVRPILQELAQPARRADMPRRIHLCEQALSRIDRAAHAALWGALQNELANSLAQTPHGDRADNLEQAIHHYSLALEVRTRQADPERWAATQNNLATAYRNRIRGDRADNLEQAIHHYSLALEVCTPEALPNDCRGTARNLGNLYFEDGRWTEASAAYDQAVRAAEVLYRSSYSPGGREAEIEENTLLYQRLVQVALEQADVAGALAYAEGSKGRAFLDQMGQAAFPPPPGLPAGLLERESDLVAQLREQEYALTLLEGQPAGDDDPQTAPRLRVSIDQRRETLAALGTVWEEMRQHYPNAGDYVAARRGEPVTWEDLAALSARLGHRAALVEFYVLPDSVLVFTLRGGWEAPRVHRAPIGREALLYRYLLPFEEEVLNRRRFRQAGRAPRDAWLELGELLLAPLLPLLEDAELVYIVPHDVLHYLPLHALSVEGRPFIAGREVTYAPSAAVLDRALRAATHGPSQPRRQRRVQSQQSPLEALVMGYTPNPAERTVFEGEAVVVADCMRTSPLLGSDATGEALRERGPGARVIHLSCHGRFRPDDPSLSGVLLASGEFTLQDWMRLPLEADLVTLSACQTGISDVGRGDDLTGLTRALLYAGASSALVTLWSVRADTTQAWMQDFYGRVWDAQGAKRVDEATAFRQATLALRERHPDPYVWAPFALVGDWR